MYGTDDKGEVGSVKLEGVRIGVAMTGSFCTIDGVLPYVAELKQQGAQILPIFSDHLTQHDTRFNTAQQVYDKVYAISGTRPIQSIVEAEPIGPKKLLDLLLVAPCTGNTIAKLANSITDTPALMAAKSHMRNGRPVVLAIASNDSLGGNAKNIGILLNAKNIFFVPFGQDSPEGKANSLQANFSLIPKTCECALEGKQLQPILLGAKECLEKLE